MKIQKIKSREILDSRGNPTVEVEVFGEKRYNGSGLGSLRSFDRNE